MNGMNHIPNVHSVVPLQTHNRHYNHCRGADQKYVKSADHIFVDRIDLQVQVQALGFSEVSKTTVSEPSSVIRERVLKARQIQEKRFAEYNKQHPPYEGGMGRVFCNAMMTPELLREHCQLDDRSLKLLQNVMTKLDLSARAYDRILKVARTIADYEGSENITSTHIAEAVSYRNLDRNSWGQL